MTGKSESKKVLISKVINDFYNRTSEEERLTIGLGPLEFERNKALIGKYLIDGDCHVVDVGGGTGKYSEWLANMGKKVWIVDPVEKHILQARRRSDKLKNRFSVILGEARHLDIPDNFADMVILHGPLYHLQSKSDRIKAINEAKRITKPGGAILGFAISYTASTIVGLLQGMIHEEGIFEMCRSELTTGEHNAPANMPGILAEAYYHRPQELMAEFEESGLGNIEMHAVEGITWLDKNFFSSRADKTRNGHLLEIYRLTENDLNLISLSPHMMIAGIKL
jgi:ubiquinone/menaquinone biosynthesis C-methylase UbiE